MVDLIRPAYLATADTAATGLGLVPGHRCWCLTVDAMVLDVSGGNLADATSIAIRSALGDTRLPRFRLLPVAPLLPPAGDSGRPQAAAVAAAHQLFIEAADDACASDTDVRLSVAGVPIYVSFAQLDHRVVVDPSREEEGCLQCRMAVGVGRTGGIYAFKASGAVGPPPDVLAGIYARAECTGRALLQALDDAQDRAVTAAAAAAALP